MSELPRKIPAHLLPLAKQVFNEFPIQRNREEDDQVKSELSLGLLTMNRRLAEEEKVSMLRRRMASFSSYKVRPALGFVDEADGSSLSSACL